jgi:hypothetical protein
MIKVAITENEHGTFSFCVDFGGGHIFGAADTTEAAVASAAELMKFYAMHGAVGGEKDPDGEAVRQAAHLPAKAKT